MVLSTEWAQVEVIDLINDGSGLAFGIIGGRSTGVVVKTIVPGGVADRDGRLQSGDHILQIGEVNLRGLGSEQVASVLRQCGVHVRMVVARPVECTSADFQTLVNSHAPVVPTKILGDPVELDKHLIANGYGDIFASIPPSNTYTTPYIFTGQQTDAQLHTVPRLVDVVRNPLSYGTVPLTIQNVATKPNVLLPLDVALRKQQNLPETETYAVQLCKDDLGLGITIAGYVCEKEELSGIFVKSISRGSAADINGMIKVNDRIVEVDGVSVIGRTNHQAVEILRSTGPLVTISFERYLRGPKYEQLQQAIRANELKPPSPPSPSVSSLLRVPVSSMNSATIEPEGESRTSVDFSAILLDAYSPTNEEVEIVIDGCRSVQFSIASHESIYEKWRQSLKDDVEIVIAELTKDSNSGLGISLEGTVDVEDGQEVRPHHYIRNILPNGPVGKNGILQSGDELLEVNGIQLMGLNHLEVVSILKQLPGFVLLVCARSYVPTRIIDTAQRRDAFKARNILAGSLQTLIPVNSERLVKAKSDSSIASSFASEVGCAELMSRSRSLELITGLPMWSDAHLVVELVKGDHGLGFSILDYQDPLNPEQTVIVIRSLIPGGVAQLDGRLIPGDRLIAVNDVNVERATLDRAVQVLKCAPRGAVKITVAKPASANESHHSQCVRKIIREWMHDVQNMKLDTDQEDQTCLDDFQECLEEYQECLEVVQICFDDDASFNHSSCMSQLEDLVNNGGVQNNHLLAAAVNSSSTKNISETELSFKSVCDNNDGVFNPRADNFKTSAKHLVKSDSTQSEKVTLTLSAKNTDEISEKDGYETCLDESLSDETSKYPEEKTPTNSSKANLHAYPTAQSEPCLSELPETERICLDTKLDRFIDEQSGESLAGDEFFLLQYSKDEVIKCCSNLDLTATTPTRYRRCIQEYYNDYEECLESYRMYTQSQAAEELTDDLIFGEILLPFKSRSAPNILDRSFVTLTYDPGPENYVRRKSAFVSGYPEDVDGDSMTVTRGKEVGATGSSKRAQVTEMLQKHWGSIRSVQINRDPDASLGISIVGGKVDLHGSDSSPETILGIFVKHVVPNSPAGRTGQLNTGDRILEVSGVDLRETNHEKAVEAIRNAPNPVTFLIQSLIPWNIDENGESREDECSSPYPSPIKIKPPEEFRTDEETQKPSADEKGESSPHVEMPREVPALEESEESAIEEPPATSDVDSSNAGAAPAPPTPPKTDVGWTLTVARNEPDAVEERKTRLIESSEESGDEEDVREMEGRTISKKGEEIDRASAANVKRTKEEIAADPEEEDHFGYTLNKVKKKYASLGHTILMVQLERSGQGLGLSLAGHKDRNCMAVFVCGINPTGAAYRTGGIQVGDEILEVNGVVLHGRCHLNASAIIKGLSGPIFKVIILRRKTAIDDIAVRPITQFPVSLAEEASEEYICSYPNVRTVTARKGPQGLGIMIIEGKHTDVGQGIFISDIQEGSAAEKAGLEIGEMILAVNKEPLLGSNYENAATLLKRTEGLVTLIVSNPTKKASTPAHAAAAAADEKASVLNDVGPGASALITTTLVPNIANTSSTAPAVKPAFKSSAPPSRPTTPVPEPPADPSTCSVHPGKETAIEINSDNRTLGLFFIGGKDTHVPEGIIVVEVYLGGAADADGRLEAGDQILEVNGTSLKDATFMTALQALRQTLPKMKLTVYRPEKLDFQAVEVDLVKKPGKGVGLSFIARKSGKGVYVSEVLNGGSADVDGKIVKGDLLISVNGQSVENSSGEETGAILKTVMGRVTLKLHRYKPTNR